MVGGMQYFMIVTAKERAPSQGSSGTTERTEATIVHLNLCEAQV
jgi:hypothetical protein